MAALVFFVKKKDSKLCPVQDYCTLNTMTVKNKYLLPLIPELIVKLYGAKYFTTLDVRWGFNNVRIKEGDKWKAAFQTNRCWYEMFFGLTNSPTVTYHDITDLSHKPSGSLPCHQPHIPKLPMFSHTFRTCGGYPHVSDWPVRR